MKTCPPPRHLALAAVLACACASSALARPYAISYQGIIRDSTIPEIINGENYTVTLVLDNSGNSAINQAWPRPVCVLWHMNNARNVVYAQNLYGLPSVNSGTVVTDGAGGLTQMFTSVTTGGRVAPAKYTATGASLNYVQWFSNEVAPVFTSEPTIGGPGGTAFSDLVHGGVPMARSFWSAPVPFDGPCFVQPAPQAPTAVPALAPWGLAVLAAGVAGLPALRCRRSRANT
jgi:hypothetical protein